MFHNYITNQSCPKRFQIQSKGMNLPALQFYFVRFQKRTPWQLFAGGLLLFSKGLSSHC